MNSDTKGPAPVPPPVPTIQGETPPIIEKPAKVSAISVILPIAITFLATSLVFGVGGYLLGRNEGVKTGKNSQIAAMLSPTPTIDTHYADDTSAWKTYRSDALTVSFIYPDIWQIEDSCTKVKGVNGPCFYTSNFKPVTQAITPGEGSESEITLYNEGTLLAVSQSASTQFDQSLYCQPGGSMIVTNCHVQPLGTNQFAIRQTGSDSNHISLIEGLLTIGGQTGADFTMHFSNANSAQDIKAFYEILTSVKLVQK